MNQEIFTMIIEVALTGGSRHYLIFFETYYNRT